MRVLKKIASVLLVLVCLISFAVTLGYRITKTNEGKFVTQVWTSGWADSGSGSQHDITMYLGWRDGKLRKITVTESSSPKTTDNRYEFNYLVVWEESKKDAYNFYIGDRNIVDLQSKWVDARIANWPENKNK